MNSPMRTRLILLAVAIVTAGAMLAWHFFWVKPQQDCVKHGGIWAAQFHSCARPVTITTELVPLNKQ